MNTKRNQNHSNSEKDSSKVSFPTEILWAFIGLLLTIFSTFLPVFTTNLPWQWADQGVLFYPLGITYQIGAVLLTGCLGGKNAGALAQIAYVILGLTWLPIFGQGGGNLEYLRQPTFGYLLGFIPGAWVCGWLAFRLPPRIESFAVSGFCGLGLIHVCGILYLIGLWLVNPAGNIITWFNLLANLFNYSVIVLPGQLVIICVMSLVAFLIRKVLFY